MRLREGADPPIQSEWSLGEPKPVERHGGCPPDRIRAAGEFQGSRYRRHEEDRRRAAEERTVMSRRLGNLMFTAELVCSFCQKPVTQRRRSIEITANALPPDAAVVNKYFD